MIYQRIESNNRKTFFLIFFFIILVLLLGWLFDYLLNYGSVGIVLALIIAVSMSLSGYYKGDKIVLKISKAKPASKKEYPYLVNIVEALALGDGLPTPNIYVLPDDSINAFATGRDPKHASIAITKGALKKLNRQEIEGVLGHEMSHIKNYDIKLMTVVSTLVGVVAVMSDLALRWVWYGGLKKDENNSGGLYLIVMLFGLLLIALSPLIAQIIQLAVSRKREYLADADSALLTHNPKGLISALKKIKVENMPMKHATTATAHMYIANPLPKKAIYNLFRTHPPIDDRIKALENL